MAAPAAEVAVAVAETPQPVTAQVVGNAFVTQYYHILHKSPGLVHKFYQDVSKLGRPEEDGSMSITTTMQAINDKIVSLNYWDFTAEIKSVDSQESFNGGVHVLVTGYLTGKDSKVSHFAQSFFLAPQDRGYFVLNDMFRYVNNFDANPALVPDVVAPVPEEPAPVPAPENHVSEQSTPSAEEAVSGEVYNPPENGDVPVTEEVEEEEEEEVPVPEVVDEVQDNTEPMVETPAKTEAPKKSYASIVMHLKETAATFSPPPTALRKAPPKSLDEVKPTPIPTPDGPVSSSDSFDHEHNQEGEADGFSIYIKGLPMNATEALLEDVFNKFGTIKNDGIQVRSNRQQGFCFGFVEFEEATSMQKALEASPVAIGGRQAFVEEKRSTNSRGSNRGRFQSGRGSGFRNEGVRGRGGYGGGRGYNRGDFNGRSEFGNRGGNRGGSANRDGYQRSESFNSNGGGRTNRAAGMANGNTKNTTPRVSATA
ncbi:nuclear transport factor 2-like isoform X2 [Salvia miltiorrhiza]|uniref:nuclear transport factor 2-like isoform X2 n=1 Tax=Salvia miltiorrhiza TaxID=226208 RepID=UPI0025AB6081|nr:nuclear transport factor 2-like isoform X2 [Salvia miltiorrhiza]